MNFDRDREWDEYDEQEKLTPKRHSIFNTPERKVHKTWNGKPVQHMESDHIMNSLMFCERKFSDAKKAHADCFVGEEDFYFASVFDMFPEYQHLRDEWFKRLKG